MTPNSEQVFLHFNFFTLINKTMVKILMCSSLSNLSSFPQIPNKVITGCHCTRCLIDSSSLLLLHSITKSYQFYLLGNLLNISECLHFSTCTTTIQAQSTMMSCLDYFNNCLLAYNFLHLYSIFSTTKIFLKCKSDLNFLNGLHCSQDKFQSSELGL